MQDALLSAIRKVGDKGKLVNIEYNPNCLADRYTVHVYGVEHVNTDDPVSALSKIYEQLTLKELGYD